jgi:hypothetical protein
MRLKPWVKEEQVGQEECKRLSMCIWSGMWIDALIVVDAKESLSSQANARG